MAASRALERLLRIRDLEEEQSRVALESALGDLSRLRRTQAATVERERRGRSLLASSARSGELPDRLAGMEETRAAGRVALALAPRLGVAERDAAALRQHYLAKRVERRQAETLVEEAKARDALRGDRRNQQSLDDWFSIRQHRAESTARKSQRTASGAVDAAAGRQAGASAREGT